METGHRGSITTWFSTFAARRRRPGRQPWRIVAEGVSPSIEGLHRLSLQTESSMPRRIRLKSVIQLRMRREMCSSRKPPMGDRDRAAG